MKKLMTIEMPDGSKWGVPVEMIARSRATHYADEFGGDVERSLSEDTLPLFADSEYEIQDWACNNMAVRVQTYNRLVTGEIVIAVAFNEKIIQEARPCCNPGASTAL